MISTAVSQDNFALVNTAFKGVQTSVKGFKVRHKSTLKSNKAQTQLRTVSQINVESCACALTDIQP